MRSADLPLRRGRLHGRLPARTRETPLGVADVLVGVVAVGLGVLIGHAIGRKLLHKEPPAQ